MNKEAYIEKFPNAIIKCSDTFKNYSRQNATNGQWITRAKGSGADLSNYREKMSKSVSSSVMSNPKERARRSAQMSENNKSPAARELSRNTAKKTSARPDIIEKRTQNLKKWREEHFDEFHEKCIKAMHSSWNSIPEKKLFNIVKSFNDSFKNNQRLYDTCITSKSKRKQVDMISETLRCIIEFDGKLHFQPLRGEDMFQDTQRRDRELNEAALKQNMTLVRISYDQFSYKDGGKFSEDCLKRLFELLCKPIPGVHYIGASYDAGLVDNVSEQLT
jgi:hypothetical protein